MGTKNKAICIYCEKNKATTRDHVPAESFFPKPRPNNLITVPCCEECNKSFQGDDEYLRMMLSSIVGNKFPEIINNVNRSLARPEGQGLRNSLRTSIARVELKSPGGIFLGTSFEVRPEFKRLYRIIDRVARGLFFHETKSLLSGNSRLISVHPSDQDRANNRNIVEMHTCPK